MTATTTVQLDPEPRPRRRVDVSPVTQRRVIKSEWIKFASLRSTWITLTVAVIASIGFSALACWAANSHWSRMGPGDRATFDAVGQSLLGFNLAQLAIVVLAVLIVTGEYATGMIRSTLMAVPRRLPALWGKLAVFAGVTFAVALVAAIVSFGIGQALLDTHGVGLGAPHAVRAIVGAALYLTVIGIMSMGIGFALRHTAGAIVAVLALLLVIPGLVGALPSSWENHIRPYLPGEAGSGLWNTNTDPGSLAPWTGFAVMCLWAAVAVGVGGWLLLRRDS